MRSARFVLVSAVLLTACGTPVTTPSASTTPASAASSPTVAATSAPPSPTGSSAPSSPSASPTPTSSPTSASTVTYGTDFALSGNTLTFQPLNWYFGAKAQARCKEKKIKSDFEWCNDYYYENAGAPTSATLAPTVTVALLGDGTVPKPSSRAALVSALRAQNIGYATLSRTADGVVAFTEVFTP